MTKDLILRDLVETKDWVKVACFIVDNGVSSLDMKVMIMKTLIQVTGEMNHISPTSRI